MLRILIEEIKFFNDDVIYVTFTFLPDVTFCGCYSPPSESYYYDVRVFANISATILESSSKFVMIGDFNAKIKNRHELITGRNDLSYSGSENVNVNGDLFRAQNEVEYENEAGYDKM